jgi:membrane associated rhomboid family serine protease
MPLFTVALILANLLVYSLELAPGGQGLCQAFGLIPSHFVPGALLSSLFLHDPSSLLHLGGNMAFLAVFGTIVERELSGFRFLALYLAAGVLGGLTHVLVDPNSAAPLVGASGCLFGLIAVAGVLRPRLLGFAVAFVGLNIWHAFTGGSDGVSFGCHLGGFVAGFLFVSVMRMTEDEALETA